MSVRCSGRRLAALAIVTALAACGGEAPQTGDATTTPASTATGEQAAGVADVPAYVVRLDSERDDPVDFEFTTEDDAVRIVTGPAGIVYDPDDTVLSGDFRVDATFTQYAAPVGYREAFGLFVGGRELDGPDLEYTYFLIRPTGDYLVKRRVGAITEVIVDWTPYAHIQRVEAEGDEPTNTLTVEVEDGQINFVVNGQLAHSMAVAVARPYGVAGLRANHRLNVRVSEWTLRARGTS